MGAQRDREPPALVSTMSASAVGAGAAAMSAGPSVARLAALITSGNSRGHVADALDLAQGARSSEAHEGERCLPRCQEEAAADGDAGGTSEEREQSARWLVRGPFKLLACAVS